MSQRDETFNILVLGKQGVGKSTLINAFANYFKFKTLENAEKSDIINLIPSKYYVDSGEVFKPQIFHFGDPESNDFVNSCCSTQKTNKHIIEIDGKIIQFIDTPWINDISPWCKEPGIFDKIMPHLPPTINIICVLLSCSDDDSMSISSTKYSINEILTHFHKTAINNMVFCFTNTRKTNYRPGKILEVIKEIGANVKKFGCDILLTHDNMYCVDNEALEYLCLMKNGIKFSPTERKVFKKSWGKSFNEMQRLLQTFENATPLFVKDSLALHETQKFASLMIKIQNDLRKQITLEDEKFEELSERLLELKYENGFLKRQNMFNKHSDLKVINESPSYLSTVCTSRKCTSTYFCKETKKTIKIYKTRCHEYCWCDASKPATVPSESLKKCKMMNKQSICINCKCPWNQHMTINYKQNVESAYKNTLDQILSNNSKIYDMEKILKNIADQKTKKKYKKICDICSKFVTIIKMHGLLAYNEITEEHYDGLITWFEGDCDYDEGRDLRNALEEYNQCISILDGHLKSTSKHLFYSNQLIFIPLEEYKNDFDVELLTYIVNKKSNPPKAITEMRISLLKQAQADGQSEENFLNQIFEMARKCEMSDEVIIPIFVQGLKNDALKTHLLSKPELSQSNEEISNLIKSFLKTVDVASPDKCDQSKPTKSNVNTKKQKKCYHCGSEKYHSYVNCFAKNEICKKCNLKGHIEDVCAKAKTSSVVFNSKFKNA